MTCFVRGFTFATIATLCVACAVDPAQSFDRKAGALGLEPGELTDGRHRLRTYAGAGLLAYDDRVRQARLHIYLDGDGRPFVTRTRIARDPTPQDPLTLELLQADPGPAIYLGRPCYHGLEADCDPRLWTTARYGEEVVASMTDAIAAVVETLQPAGVVLIGYSGGGALAVLIADRLPAVDAVVTLAANLDTDAWVSHHGYTPLIESINPARSTAERAIPQLHFSGAADTNVPPGLQDAYATGTANIEFRVVEGFGHDCCWAATWPARLEEIDDFLDDPTAGPAPR